MDFEQMINAMRDKLDDATKGKVSEDLIAILGEYRSQKQTLEDAQASNKKLTADNEAINYLVNNYNFVVDINKITSKNSVILTSI